MTDVSLSPEQERFAAEIIAMGRYRSLTDVVSAALDELERMKKHRAALLASVAAAAQEGERDGFLTIDEVRSELDELIEEMAHESP